MVEVWRSGGRDVSVIKLNLCKKVPTVLAHPFPPHWRPNPRPPRESPNMRPCGPPANAVRSRLTGARDARRRQSGAADRVMVNRPETSSPDSRPETTVRSATVPDLGPRHSHASRR